MPAVGDLRTIGTANRSGAVAHPRTADRRATAARWIVLQYPDRHGVEQGVDQAFDYGRDKPPSDARPLVRGKEMALVEPAVVLEAAPEFTAAAGEVDRFAGVRLGNELTFLGALFGNDFPPRGLAVTVGEGGQAYIRYDPPVGGAPRNHLHTRDNACIGGRG